VHALRDSEKVKGLDPSSRLRVAKHEADNLAPDRFGTVTSVGRFDERRRHRQTDADRFDRKRSAPTNLPTPVASTAAVGK
jgi:hypothetical protein